MGVIENLEKLLRKETDCEQYTGDINPIAPHNLAYNIAWEVFHAMKREDRLVVVPRDELTDFTDNLRDAVKASEEDKNYIHNAMRRIGLITKKGVLAIKGQALYHELVKVDYYADDSADD